MSGVDQTQANKAGPVPTTKWLAEHIEKMLGSIKEDKAGLGQGRNLTKTQFQDAAMAINEAFKDMQNKDKSLANMSNKGLLAWDKKSGVSYNNNEFGCGVTPETQTMWNALLAEHKNVAPYLNKPWLYFSKMQAICDSSVTAKGEKVFAPHNTPGPLALSQLLTVEKELDAPDVESTSHPKKLELEVDLEPGATEVTYSSDEDVVILDKVMSPAHAAAMSLTSLPVNNTALYSVPKLAADGSNWITYKERILTCMGTRGLMRHLNSTAHHPPNPPSWPRPSIATTSSASASSAKPAAAASSATTEGEDKSAATSQKPTASGSKVQPLSNLYASLSDDNYFKKVEEAEAKANEYEQCEFMTHQQIYSTISDTMLIKVKSLPVATQVWAALVNEYEGKSEMYANVIHMRLLTTKCAEGANSLPESYGYLLTVLSTTSCISNNPITPTNIIQALNEEYDRRTSQSPSSDSALAAYPSSQSGRQGTDIECFNCHRKGHLKSDCWQKGGGKKGQGLRDQTPKRGQCRGGSKGGPSANTVTELSKHAFAITIDSTVLASTAATEDRVEIFDSGATHRLQPTRPITAANGHTFMAVSEGQVRMSLLNGNSSTVITLDSGETVSRIPSVNGLYQVHHPDVAAAAVVGCGTETEMSVLEFHRCMGHISPVIAKKMLKEG
ncbi:transcription factor [Ganoderma sinense ZZ0214-1]|uniref:Transcription factor n=1 Tax=Ganoderma sinense ZZ0214-1 TaxID=1077348 RepID=A0A2G8SDX2_9APHY|nr:transcription factor [Ganoderma sinense ZZ0214-1]